MKEEQINALRQLYRLRFGVEPEAVTPLDPHASKRFFYRLQSGEQSVVGIFDPQVENRQAFVGFTKYFHAAGLPVPEILAATEDLTYCLETDLGGESLYDRLLAERLPDGSWPESLIDLYVQVVELLPRFQIDVGPTTPELVFPRTRRFDSSKMLEDVRRYRHELLARLGAEVDESALIAECAKVTEHLQNPAESYFMHRDFQSRNIMIVRGAPWIIDYQSAHWGPLEYDVASLLFQVRAQVPDVVREQLLARYLARVAERIAIDEDRFRERFAQIAVLRIIQVLEAYGRVGLGDGKEYFLKGIAPALQVVSRLIDEAGLTKQLPVLTDSLQRAAARFNEYMKLSS